MLEAATNTALTARAWPVRLARAVAGAHVAIVTAAVGHVVAGGCLGSPVLLAGLGAFVAAAVLALGSRRLTFGQLLGLLVLVQIGVHLDTMIGTDTMRMTPLMLGAHAAAAVVAAVVLRRGEVFLWGLADRVGLRRVVHRPAGFVVPRLREAAVSVAAPVLHATVRATSRLERGPPVVA